MSLCCPECGAFFTEILSPLPGGSDQAAPYIVRFYCKRCRREAFYNLAACLSQSVRAGLLLSQSASPKKEPQSCPENPMRPLIGPSAS